MDQLVQLDTVSTELAHAEEVIERAARNAFEEWGAQLKHIRDNRLYIAFSTGCTWEQYTQDRWEMTPQRAGQLIASYDAVKEMQKFFVEQDEDGKWTRQYDRKKRFGEILNDE